MGGQSLLIAFDRFKSFGHDDLTAKHCYISGAHAWPPNFDEINIKFFSYIQGG